MAKKQLQSVVELEQNRISIIRTIAVREKSYWNKAKCFCCPEDAAEFAKPLFENADKEYLVFHPLINSTFWRAMYQQLFLLIHQCHQDCISNGTQSVLHLFLQNICRYDS